MTFTQLYAKEIESFLLDREFSTTYEVAKAIKVHPDVANGVLARMMDRELVERHLGEDGKYRWCLKDDEAIRPSVQRWIGVGAWRVDHQTDTGDIFRRREYEAKQSLSGAVSTDSTPEGIDPGPGVGQHCA